MRRAVSPSHIALTHLYPTILTRMFGGREFRWDGCYGLSLPRSVCPERIFPGKGCERSLVGLVASILTRSRREIRGNPVSGKSGPGRPGWLPTQVPHRSGLAHHAHPVPHLMNSRPARSVVVTWTWFRSRCTCQVSLQRLMRRHPLPSTGSLGLVPPL